VNVRSLRLIDELGIECGSHPAGKPFPEKLLQKCPYPRKTLVGIAGYAQADTTRGAVARRDPEFQASRPNESHAENVAAIEIVKRSVLAWSYLGQLPCKHHERTVMYIQATDLKQGFRRRAG